MDTNEQALVQVAASSPPRLLTTQSGPMPPHSNASTPRSRGRTSPTPAWPSTLRACTPSGFRRPSPQWRVAAVKFRCRLQGLASPVGPATDRVLAGLRREGKGRGRGQVDGVRFSQVDGVRFSQVDTAAAVAANDGGSVTGLRDAAWRWQAMGC